FERCRQLFQDGLQGFCHGSYLRCLSFFATKPRYSNPVNSTKSKSWKPMTLLALLAPLSLAFSFPSFEQAAWSAGNAPATFWAQAQQQLVHHRKAHALLVQGYNSGVTTDVRAMMGCSGRAVSLTLRPPGQVLNSNPQGLHLGAQHVQSLQHQIGFHDIT